MSQNSKTAKSAEEGGNASVPRPSIFVAISALLGGPKKKLIVIGGASILILLGLVTAAIIAVLQTRKPAPLPARVAPTPLQQKQEQKPEIKSGVEERFEAIKRGEFARIQPNQKAQEPESDAPVERAREGPARSEAAATELSRDRPPSPGKDPALADKVGGAETSGAESPDSPAKKKTPPSALTATGCDVGASDPKATADAILACILEFNAMESRERSGKPAAKKIPPPN